MTADGRAHVDVDEIWKSLGTWGKYQRRQLLVYLFSVISWVFHGLTIVFIGYRPDYKCKTLPIDRVDNITHLNTSIAWREYDTCKIRHYTNDSSGIHVVETGCVEGYEYGIQSEQSFVTEWDLVCGTAALAELTQALLNVGQAIGATVFTGLSDRIGRKPVMVMTHVSLFAFALGTSFVPNYIVFTVLRVLTGAVQQGLGLSGSTLALETYPREVRAYTETLALIVWTTAICCMAPVAYFMRHLSWRYVQLTFALCSVWSLIQWWLFDESLRWLIANNKLKEAREVIKRACKTNGKNYEDVISKSGFDKYETHLKSGNEKSPHSNFVVIPDIVEDSFIVDKTEPTKGGGETLVISAEKESLVVHPTGGKQEAPKKYTALDILKRKRILVVSVIIWFTWITDAIVYYGIYLISASLAGDRFINFLISGVVEYPSALMEFLLINRIGRKWTVILYHIIALVSLVGATILMTKAAGSSSLLIASTAFVMIGKVGSTGAFSAMFIYTPELYPTNMRNAGFGMASAAGRIGSTISPFFRNLAEKVVWGPCAVFSIMCGLVVVSMLFLPETSGHELPQTMTELKTWYKDNRAFAKKTKGKQTVEVELIID